MSTTSKMVISGILAILVVAISSGSYSITQVNAQNATQAPPGLPASCAQNFDAECERLSQEGMRQQECSSLSTTDPQYQSKGCADFAPK
jgi:hypothetical protein